MNVFLWLGVACTVVLLASLVFDATDGIFDAFEALDVFDAGDWLSLPVLAAFGGAFGFGTGAVYSSMGLAALVPGLAIGLLFGYLTVRLVRTVQDTPADAAESQESMRGVLAKVITAPTASSLGEVVIERANGPRKVSCKADGPIAVGTEVVVVDVLSSTLVTITPFNEE